MHRSDPRLFPKFCRSLRISARLCLWTVLDLDCHKQTFRQPRRFKMLVMSFTVRPVFSLP